MSTGGSGLSVGPEENQRDAMVRDKTPLGKIGKELYSSMVQISLYGAMSPNSHHPKFLLAGKKICRLIMKKRSIKIYISLMKLFCLIEFATSAEG